MPTAFISRLRRFRREESGVYALETVIFLPVLIWVVLASVTFVDAYEMQVDNLRATYTVSDALSRRWDPVDQDYFDGLARLLAFQTDDRHPTSMRLTVIYYDKPDDEHVRVWSKSNDVYEEPLDQGDIDRLHDSIPMLANGDSLVIVDTWMNYTPPFDIAVPPFETRLDAMRFSNRIFVSPRFIPQLLWEDDGSGAGSDSGSGRGRGRGRGRS